MLWQKKSKKKKRTAKLCLLTSRSASSQTAPVIRAKMASSQSCWKHKTNLKTLTCSCVSLLCFVRAAEWMVRSCFFSSSCRCCRGSYFGVLVQQQSSFRVPALLNQLFYKQRKQTILELCAKTLCWTPVWLSTRSRGYLPGLWPAVLTGRAEAGSAVRHKLRFSNWSCQRTPEARWLVPHIATAAGRPAPPAAAPLGAQHRRSSEPAGQRSKSASLYQLMCKWICDLCCLNETWWSSKCTDPLWCSSS